MICLFFTKKETVRSALSSAAGLFFYGTDLWLKGRLALWLGENEIFLSGARKRCFLFVLGQKCVTMKKSTEERCEGVVYKTFGSDEAV